LCTNRAHYPYDQLETELLHSNEGVLMLMTLAPERPEGLTETAARVAELEAMLARRSNDRKRLVDAFGDDDDPMLIDAIRQLGLEVKRIEADLAEARKVAKTIEHSDRRDFWERYIKAVQLMASSDLNERQAARAKLAQVCRCVIDVITLHRDHRFTVRMKMKEDDVIIEKQLSREGWVRSNLIRPDGTVLRVSVSTLSLAPELVPPDDSARTVFGQSGFRLEKAVRTENGSCRQEMNPNQKIDEREYREVILARAQPRLDARRLHDFWPDLSWKNGFILAIR
jgi:hypothetical protein